MGNESEQITVSGEHLPKKGKKRMPAVVVIDEIIANQENPELLAEILQLQENFKKLTDEHANCTLKDEKSLAKVSADFLLEPLIKSFKEKESEAIALIENNTINFNRMINHIDYHEILQKELLSAIEELQLKNQQRNQLSIEILQRYTLLAPTTNNCEELQLYQNIALNLLEKNLEKFLINFSMLNLQENQDQDNLYFNKQLVDFINELTKNLQTTLTSQNKSKIAELHDMLLQHLGERTTWFQWKATPTLFEVNKANQFLWDLFFTEPSGLLDESTLKKRITGIYHIAAIIEAFPLKSIKNYHAYKTVEVTQNTFINNQRIQLADNMAKLLVPLRDLLNLFPGTYHENSHFIAAEKHRETLALLQADLIQIHTNYDDAKKRFITDLSPLSRLENITILQQKTIKAFADLSQNINTILPDIEHRLSTLENIYNTEKKLLNLKLKTSINDAKAALLIMGKSLDGISKMLKPYQEFSAKIMSESNNLNTLNYEVTVSLKTLSQYVETTKLWLQETISPKLHLLQIKLDKFFLSDSNVTSQPLHPDSERPITAPGKMGKPLHLNKLNPFKDDLQTKSADANVTVEELNRQFLQLNDTNGLNLKNWLNTLEKTWLLADEKISERDEIYRKAQEIERRLCTNEYLASLAVLNTIQIEYIRIISTYIDNALKKPLLHLEKSTLIHLKNDPLAYFLSPPELSAMTETILNKIDTRLFKLLSMYAEFKIINTQYINKDIAMLNDQTYLARLIADIETHLRNDHMEKISDGIRPQFIQWIRINIFKPLQAVKNGFAHPSHHFFITAGACKTEKALVKLGNDVYCALMSEQIAPVR